MESIYKLHPSATRIIMKEFSLIMMLLSICAFFMINAIKEFFLVMKMHRWDMDI